MPFFFDEPELCPSCRLLVDPVFPTDLVVGQCPLCLTPTRTPRHAEKTLPRLRLPHYNPNAKRGSTTATVEIGGRKIRLEAYKRLTGFSPKYQ